MNEDKAARYHRLRRRVSVLSILWSTTLLSGLLWTGASAWLRDAAQAAAVAVVGHEHFALSLGLYLLTLLACHEAGDAVSGYYGTLLLERRFGLSTQTTAGWLADRAKAFAIAFVLGDIAAALLYWTIGVGGAYWWIVAAGLFGLLLAVLANLAPVLLMPLFYTVRPLTSDALRGRLVSLAERAGTRVLGAYEWGLGEKSRKANAALAGLGTTRRILVSDTMIEHYSEDEIEVVLAHEIAHHVHGHIWKGLAFELVVLVVGFFVAAQVLTAVTGQFGVSGAGDLAALPVVLLTAGGVSVLLAPVARALSRAHERSADQYALELTRNPSAFVSAMRRLGAQNLAEEQPSRLVEVFFHSHPPLAERISAANAFRR